MCDDKYNGVLGLLAMLAIILTALTLG